MIFEVTLEASAGFKRKKQVANPVKDTGMIFMLALEAAPLARDLLLWRGFNLHRRTDAN